VAYGVTRPLRQQLEPRGWSIPCLIGPKSLRLSVPRRTGANAINTGAFAP